VNAETALFFRNALRQARASVLKDAEAYEKIIHVFEGVGRYLCRNAGGLGSYEGAIKAVACLSPLARDVPSRWRELHMPFDRLFKSVQEGRNAAMHEGAFARHLATHSIRLALILEDALMNDSDRVGDWMVSNPVCAELWHPLSFVRQMILEGSFSFLPVKSPDAKWRLISDLEIAKYLRGSETPGGRKARLVQSLADAEKPGGIKLQTPTCCKPTDSVADVLKGWDGTPILVVRENGNELLGIVTAFDLV
jgi:CBS domain-containing protein